MTASNMTEDPAEIEREIRITQENMSSTVEKIGDQLSIKNVFNALLDKADDSNVDARMVLDGARRNPVALALIAAGTIWLISEKDAKLPSINLKSKKPNADRSAQDFDHNAYVSHMSAVEQSSDEDEMAYQRRRDNARANFLMVERDHGEDESSFRKRLDSVTASFRQKRHDWAASSGQAGTAAKEKAEMAAGKAQDLYSDNPLVGGIIAMAVGAAFGSAVPTTRREQQALGSIGEKARNVVEQQKEQVTGKVREKKDQLLDKADAALKQSTDQSNSVGGAADGAQQEQAPFMMGH